MIFAPTIKVSELASDSSSFTVEDTTPAVSGSAPYGYGAPNAPINFAAIDNVQILLQYLTELPVQMLTVEGTLNTGAKASYTIRDGVQYIQVLYGIADHQGTWAILDIGGKSIQLTLDIGETRSLADILDGITYLALADYPDILYKVASTDLITGIVTLSDAITSVTSIVTQLVRYYSAVTTILVINSGNSSLVKDIANMAIKECGCDSEVSKGLIDRVILKLAAQTHFSKGNYIKAHNAAVLLDDAGQTTQSACATC